MLHAQAQVADSLQQLHDTTPPHSTHVSTYPILGHEVHGYMQCKKAWRKLGRLLVAAASGTICMR
jgi:hypothetical protein